MCDVSELDRVREICDQESRERKTPERVTPYLAAYREWVRRGMQGRPPQTLDYGLMVYDVMNETSRVKHEVLSDWTGLSTWCFYDDNYFDPVMEIRQIADQLGLNPDDAHREFHAAGDRERPWFLTAERDRLLDDYRYAMFEFCRRLGRPEYRFVLAGYEGRKEKKEARIAPLLFNPHRRTGASSLLRSYMETRTAPTFLSDRGSARQRSAVGTSFGTGQTLCLSGT